MTRPLSRKRIWTARLIAVGADALQLALLPLFAGGAPEGFDAVLDVVVALLLCGLCGFHLAFLPTFVAEALPTLDILPSWTLAVLHVTRNASEPAPQLPEGGKIGRKASR